MQKVFVLVFFLSLERRDVLLEDFFYALLDFLWHPLSSL